MRRLAMHAMLIAAACGGAPGSLAKSMNGEYLIGNPSGVPDPFHAKDKYYNTDMSSRYEYFDVYSPQINSTYGMVYWTMMDAVPLPESIVRRFDGKTMAIMGYETDQVMADGTSVPINWAYNHHFTFYVNGKDGEVARVQASPRDHGHMAKMNADGTMWMGRRKLESAVKCQFPTEQHCDIPTTQFFAEGNGGEFRKSYHGYPRGYAQLLASPREFQFAPMQIDTWNRDRMRKPGDPFVPGPVPKAAQSPPDAVYSGLLECPCTDRLSKQINATFSTRVSGACGGQQRVWSASDCFHAVAELAPSARSVQKQTINDPSAVPGCSFRPSHDGVTAVFNSASTHIGTGTAAGCGSGQHTVGVSTMSTGVAVSLRLELDGSKDQALMTLTGPASVWFGVGFNATEMADLPYTIIIDGNGKPSERKLGDHVPGSVLDSTVSVVSNAVADGVRTVVLKRGLKAAAKQGYYSFDLSADATIPLIVAVGSTKAFAYHHSRGTSSISLANVRDATCVCATGAVGAFCGNTEGGCLTFSNHGGQSVHDARCPVDTPWSVLAAQNNPTCTVQQYRGGLACCHHLNILTDKDQNPWPKQELQYRMKFRFYFQDYHAANASAPASHQNLVRFYWQTESFAGEYDVPKGGLDGKSDTYAIHSQWKVQDMIWKCDPATSPDKCNGGNATGIELIYAGGHCHAPSCQKFELWNDDTNVLLCRMTPVYGKDSRGPQRFQEDGYVALPPCLWGDEEGLVKPVYLPFNTTLRSIKVNNATYGHTGEMASWQMRGVLVKK